MPSAPVRKHRAAISPCPWDLLPTPSSSGWAVSEAPQAPALLCAPSMSPVPDLGAAGCDPSTPHHLPSPVLFQGGVHNPSLWMKTLKVLKSCPVLGMCLNSVLPALESTGLFLL